MTVVRATWRLAVHLSAFIRGVLGPVRLTSGERRFIEANRELWSELGTSADVAGDVLVEPLSHPVLMHANASFAAIVGRSRKLGILFTLLSPAERRAKVLLSSYPNARFVYVHSPRTLPTWIRAWVRAIRVYRTLRVPRDILSLTENGRRYGDLIYDTLLARGYATVRTVDLWTLVTLQRYFYYATVTARIAREHDVRCYVSSHGYIGLLQGTLTRTLVRKRIEVLSRIGTRELILRRYRGPEGIGEYELRPEAPVLAALLEDPSGEAKRHADLYIQQRFADEVDDPSARLAFDRRRRLYTDAGDFARDQGLDPSKPLVFVMLHAFNDYPHSHFRKPFIFQDYYDWFIRTLERARSVTSVNWIVKEHPGSDYYPTKDLDLGRVMAGIRDPHIRFLPRDADFNAASLRHIAHAIVTCMGSAGMEYACVGIPCIVAGEGPYTGYGFTRESSSGDAYLAELEHVADLCRLTSEQIRVARLIAWYMMGLVYDYPYLLSPQYEYWQIADFRKVDVWSDVATILRTVDRVALRRQIEVIDGFLASEHPDQLLNVDKYPFLRAAFGHPDRAA